MEQLTKVFSVLFIITIIFIALVILLEKRNPAKSMAWLLVLTYVPILGFILYILFGFNWRKNKWISDNDVREFVQLEEQIMRDCYQEQQPEEIKAKLAQHPAANSLVNLAMSTSRAPVLFNQELELIFDGQQLYESIFEDISLAKDHIHIIFFIIRSDEVGQKLKDILIKKAKEGCQVRLIYDHIGSTGIENRYVEELIEAGVKVKSFLPVYFPMINRRLNYRNHRKIAVVDGQVAYTGGFNMGNEYVGGNKRLGYWRDTHVRVKGASVHNLQIVFLRDWYYVSREKVCCPSFFPPIDYDRDTSSLAQVVHSGPDSKWPGILQTYFSIITNARESIWLTTPYLVPDEPILLALKNAALSGIDVRIILPGKPDHYSIYFATHSYIEELLEVGVKVYLYQQGFIHSKLLVCDQYIISVGSANFNMRSSYIDFEANLLIYDQQVAARAIQQLKIDMNNSNQLDYFTYKMSKPWYRKFIEAVARLFSPII